jgi:DNA-binding CsgD family transcriptional regulator
MFSVASGHRKAQILRSSAPSLRLGEGSLREGDFADKGQLAQQLFAEGHTHHQIALQLGISHHTVRNQLANVYRKLDIHSKLELVRALT